MERVYDQYTYMYYCYDSHQEQQDKLNKYRVKWSTKLPKWVTFWDYYWEGWKKIYFVFVKK